MTDIVDDGPVIVWAKFLDDYARDWAATFGGDLSTFSSEFWFLLVGCTLAYWRGRPMTVSAACQSMMAGSSSTRESRIKRAVQQGLLEKKRAGVDGRSAVVLPTAKTEAMMKAHFSKAFDEAKAALGKYI